MDLIDTHCHINVEAFDSDRDAVLVRCREKGINRIIVPAIEAQSWDSLLNLCQRETGLFPALGLHPVYIDKHKDADLVQLTQRLTQDRPVAVGEIGLDFFITELDRERQQAVFEAQLVMAREMQLPAVLHVRKAHDQVLATLRRIKVTGGICHAFNGSLQQARQYIDLGFKLGFGGTLTYAGSKKIRSLARELPIESIVLETDAPDMVVSAHRGERNSPEYLTDCLAALAEIRASDPDTIAGQTTRNACDLFKF